MSQRKPRFHNKMPASAILAMLPADYDMNQMAQALGVSRTAIRRMLKPNAMLNWVAADKLAIRLGSHPAYIWGDLWLDELSPVQETASTAACTVTPPTTEEPCPAKMRRSA